MDKTKVLYNESTGLAIHAMMESAEKDEFVDKKLVVNFPKKHKKNKKQRDVTLKDIREWNKKRIYKGDTEITVNAMMDSALNDPYADKNPPSRF